MFRRILVPLDGSQLAEAALAYADVLAGQMNSELVLLRVVAPQPVHPLAEHVAMHGDDTEEANEYVDSIASRLRRKGLKVETSVQVGSPAEQIIEFAQGNAISLVVMSTHGRSGIGRWVYGSVADRVLRGADLPVLLVRSGVPLPSQV